MIEEHELTTENQRPTLKEAASAVLCRVKDWFGSNFSSTVPALYFVSLTVATLIVSLEFSDVYWPTAVGYCVSFAVVFGLLLLGTWIISLLCRLVFKRKLKGPLSAAVLAFSLFRFFAKGTGGSYTFRTGVFATGVLVVIWLLVSTVWSMARHRRVSVTTVLTAVISLALTAGTGWMIFSDGFANSFISDYLALTQPVASAAETPELSFEPGPYEVEMLDYGTENGLASQKVSLIAFADRNGSGFNGKYAEYYLDYSLQAVPLVGRIWYPSGGEKCPVLFIAHGNHKIAEPSYEGYEYLGEYLASHGYVVVSVDQNSCNMLSGENDGRAVLLLRHIGQVLEYSKDKDNPIYGLIDKNNIAIAGHSRGGEMVSTAYLFNSYDRYPENGMAKFDFNYSIKSIIALAPTVNQYKPADHSVEIEDVNYLLLHGTEDSDVKNFMGMTQYENVSFTGQGDYIKSALYIAGANHGQFNSLWGEYDKTMPYGKLINTENLISQDDQQEIAAVFIKTFLDVTLKEDDTCRELLTDWDDYADQLPETVYVQCSESSDFVPMADFEEDSDLETCTEESVDVSVTGARVWTEEQMKFGGDGTYALRLKWNREVDYTLKMPRQDVSDRELTFDVANLDEDVAVPGEYSLLDGEVILTDSMGKNARANITDFATVFPPISVHANKLDCIFNDVTYRNAFATVNIPVESFKEEKGFNPESVVEVSFVFEGKGDIAMDNIGWNK